MIATGLTFLFGFFLACLLALLLSPIVWRRSRRLARREFEATIPTSANEIRASYDHVRAAAALETRTREMEAAAAVERAASERANAGRISIENAGLRERNGALITLLSEHKAAFEEIAEALEVREGEFDKLEAELHETHHELDLRSEELDALTRQFRVLVGRAEEGGIDTGFDAEDLRDEAAGDRPSRIEMQKTIKALSAQIETLRTDLRQQQSTVRERDATILDLLAGVADAQSAGLPIESAASPAGQPVEAVGAAPVPETVDARALPAVQAPNSSTDDAEARKTTATGIAGGAARDIEALRDVQSASARVDRPFGQALPAGAVSTEAALPAPKSFSSLFASRIREALRRPQMPLARPRDTTSAPMTNRPVAEDVPGRVEIAPGSEAGVDEAPSATAVSEDAVPTSIARRLRETLQLPDHPLGTDDVDDETLRQRIVDLAARVIDQVARIEGKASPIETILTADRSFSSSSRPRERQTLTDRVRMMRHETEAAE